MGKQYRSTLLWIIIFNTLFFNLFAQNKESCARMATINHQEVLVDTSSSKKGEGLRFYLEKDSEAKHYLDDYQKSSELKWYNALIGTAGTALIAVGIAKSGKMLEGNALTSQSGLIIGGLSLVLLNILVVKTFQYNDEKLLLRSIEEYNKRNLPKIFFSPFQNELKGQNQSDFGVSAGILEEF